MWRNSDCSTIKSEEFSERKIKNRKYSTWIANLFSHRPSCISVFRSALTIFHFLPSYLRFLLHVILFLFFKSFLSTCFLLSSIPHCLSSQTPEATSSITYPQSDACCCCLKNYPAPAGNSTSYNILQKFNLSDTAVYRVLTATNTAT